VKQQRQSVKLAAKLAMPSEVLDEITTMIQIVMKMARAIRQIIQAKEMIVAIAVVAAIAMTAIVDVTAVTATVDVTATVTAIVIVDNVKSVSLSLAKMMS
jgi:hypothetical protein